HGGVHLRLPQRHAAGGHHARHGVLVPARRQRAGREGVRVARNRLLRGGSADRLRLRAGAGLRAHHGGYLRGPETRHRRSLRPHRPALEDRGMTETTAPPTAIQPAGFAATLSHARYVLVGNLVTASAFVLFALILVAALVGPV